jgi:hypothetical protein
MELELHPCNVPHNMLLSIGSCISAVGIITFKLGSGSIQMLKTLKLLDANRPLFL